MLKIKIQKNNATVLVTVIMLTLAMTTLAVGLLSAIGNQGFSGQNQVDRIKAEQLAKGAFWKYYSERMLGTTGSAPSETLDGKTYSTAVAFNATTNAVSINASY